MDRGVAVVLAAVVGGFVALQGPINSDLGKTIGNFQAAFFSFATGTIVLAIIAGLAKGGFGQIAEVETLAPQYLIGGAARRLLRLDGARRPCARSAPAASSPRRSPAS